MNKELKDQWTAALRSGEYNQGKSALRKDDNTYCCLGVLCEVMNLEKTTRGYRYNYGEMYGVLSDDLLAAVEMIDSQQTTLTELNDWGSSFNDIADYIDEYV